MKQTTDLKFVTKEIFKNGSIKLHFIESEVYGILYSLGYRFVRIDRKPFYYKIDDLSKIRLIKHFQEFRDAFAGYLKQLDIPVNERNEILNTYYSKMPIKRNGSIERYLADTVEPGFWLISEIKRQTEDFH
ncbi:MAG: hypothetical protein M0P58_08340 [Bacteroidales bacterium]|jgi:hypothetical protein|nr:hypothetical protein [Bacteroidales bacterium]